MEMICIKKGPWRVIDGPDTGKIHSLGPFYLEAVEVSPSSCYTDCFVVKGYEHYPNHFGGKERHIVKRWFVKPSDISELTSILESIEEPVTQ
jgi:hypothetical protein